MYGPQQLRLAINSKECTEFNLDKPEDVKQLVALHGQMQLRGHSHSHATGSTQFANQGSYSPNNLTTGFLEVVGIYRVLGIRLETFSTKTNLIMPPDDARFTGNPTNYGVKAADHV